MKTEVLVRLEKNEFQVSGDYQNYKVVEVAGWDLGRPLGYGSTKDFAIQDFIEDWQLKFDETITVKII